MKFAPCVLKRSSGYRSGRREQKKRNYSTEDSQTKANVNFKIETAADLKFKKRLRRWAFFGVIFAAASASVTFVSNDGIKKLLQRLNVGLLDDEASDVLSELRLLKGLCGNRRWWNKVIENNAVMELIHEASKDDDIRIKVMAFKCMAALSAHADSSREAVLQLVDPKDLIKYLYDSKPLLAADRARGPQKFLAPSADIDTEVVNATEVTLANSIEETLAYLSADKGVQELMVKEKYPAYIAEMLKDLDKNRRVLGVRTASELSYNLLCRAALAKQEIFPYLYTWVYAPKGDTTLANDGTPQQKENIRLAKYCMQQLLLSQSAVEILVHNNETLLKKMSVKAKDDLLSNFDYEKDGFGEMLWELTRDTALASTFGFFWAPSRHIWERIRAGSAVPSLGSALKTLGPKSFVASAGMILFYELYLYAERDHLSKWGSDSFFLAQSALAPLFAVGVAFTFQSIAPYTFFPALVGKTGRGLETSFRTAWLKQQQQQNGNNTK